MPISMGRSRARGRPVIERILFRAPALARWINAFVFALPLGSWPRRRLLAFFIGRTFAAADRGDLELVMTVLYDPSAELTFGTGFTDFDQTYRGREELFAAYKSWVETW
jgi:hypothetical protein